MYIIELNKDAIKGLKDIADFYGILSEFHSCGGYTEEKLIQLLEDRRKSSIITYICRSDRDEIIGTASILIEHKMWGLAGHIEDVVVHRNWRGMGVGRSLIDKCVWAARKFDCYKVVLDCETHNIPFYERCGFKRGEAQMRMDLA